MNNSIKQSKRKLKSLEKASRKKSKVNIPTNTEDLLTEGLNTFDMSRTLFDLDSSLPASSTAIVSPNAPASSTVMAGMYQHSEINI
jgi:hypothetical protein